MPPLTEEHIALNDPDDDAGESAHQVPRVTEAICSTPWAIDAGRLEQFMQVLELRSRGIRLTRGEIAMRIGIRAENARPEAAAGVRIVGGGTAVVPVIGVLSHRGNMVDDLSGPGGASIQRLQRQFREAMADPAADTVVMEFDSPGGSVEMIEEFGDQIFEARQQKRIIAVANTFMASAAYWLGSQAHEVVVTPSGEIGSIGVVATHIDRSEADKMKGMTFTVVHAGRHKAELSDMAPISEEALGRIQTVVDMYYDRFVKAVSRGRNVDAKIVRGESFGEGRSLLSNEAKKAGLVDKVATLDQVIGDITARRQSRTRRAQARRRLAIGG